MLTSLQFTSDLSGDPLPNPVLAKLALESGGGTKAASRGSSESLERDSGTGDSKKSSDNNDDEEEDDVLDTVDGARQAGISLSSSNAQSDSAVRAGDSSPRETDRLIQRGEPAVGAGESR